jgi:nucleoside-diphosphate-sugar epimerase
MRIFLTGGSGDLGQMLCTSLRGMGHTPVVFDVRDLAGGNSNSSAGLGVPDLEFINGSVLDRSQLKSSLTNIDVVVHIAAWHGIHQIRNEKNAYDFFDLNVGGTFNVFQSALENGIKNIVFISSTSIDDRYGLYGNSKLLAEEIARAYALREGMNVITLRPRAFIPPWNRVVYKNFVEWAKWFSKGAVHISDVAQAVIKSINLVAEERQQLLNAPLFLTVDGAYQYTDEDLASWDEDGPGSTFRKYYEQFYDLAISMGLDPSLKPSKLDITETERLLKYRPLYSMKTLLLELKMYGSAGPYADRV